jgi:DNA-binding transcriptional LysR family regulator
VDTRQLAAFVAVVDHGSFSLAAEQLGVTQPAVSLAVRSLEKRLGERLLDRGGRRIEPTAAGRLVLARAQRMLQLEQEMAAALLEESETLGGRLVVGASTGPGSRMLPRLLVGFRRAHPDVAVALRIDSTQTVIDRVLARELELGVVGAERGHRSLEYEPFMADEVVLAVPPGHPFAGREITLDELRAAPMILQQEGSGIRALMERELRAAGVRPRDLDVVAELGLQESAKVAVAEGLGVTFTSRASIHSEVQLGMLAEARVEGVRAARSYLLVRAASREPSRLVEAFLGFAREELARSGDAP